MDEYEGIEEIVHEPSAAFAESTNVAAFMREYGIDDYEELIERTTSEVADEPASGVDWFWDEIVDYLDIEFYTEYDAVRDSAERSSAGNRTQSGGDSDGPQFSDWYPGGEINVAHNVVDRHAAVDSPNRNRVALIWEGEPGDVREVTFHELARQTNRVANYLESVGVETGDTVGLYMPMVPEVVSILYGCLKVGAIAVPIFSGFGTEATATRIADAEPAVLFTGDGFYRRGSEVRLKATADAAIEEAGHVEHAVVYDRLGATPAGADDAASGTDTEPVQWTPDRDVTWTEAIASQPVGYETKRLPSDQESMLLYSSGTTGEPKGIVHTHAGVLTQCAKEIHFGFDQQPADRFFWVSDIGWMMGPWTLIGNHAFGGTVVMYEGAPDHPEPDRFWELIERHSITQFGISPTAIRALRKHGDQWVEGHDLSSLRILGSTGEPWDPESWRWFYDAVGGGDCPIINISGGTEICGCFLMPMPNQPLKPCTLGGPGLGMAVDIVDETGESVRESGDRGYLVARDSCPSMTKSLWSGDERYLEEYWSTWEDLWDHGDFAQEDADGFWFLHGRADDALNVAGRKVGPAEIEGVLIDHDAVNQAAAVGVPDDTTGTAVVAYVVLEPGVDPSDDLREELRTLVGEEHGKPFRPRELLFVDAFPKTQSGKIIRRAIESVYKGEDPGDLSSMENPESLADLRDPA
ncbi:AMP-binding protein [Halorubrum kocurii]|uniref:acetate--CoA ligase n=1 Tax=Halorubrum kocurii JCM 14978 TaxID=1230456 RepID=M0NMM0_9EURY|nr:AMP-binding protein [Halorubrum kocurii]EMA57910.1 AMP-dependent synthetase and ligase [Halorubrum kocurii JCM 14978]